MIKNCIHKILERDLRKPLVGLFLLGLLGAPLHSVHAQTVVNFDYTNNMQDAFVANGGVENTNFGTQDRINAYHQVGQQIPMVFRTYIQYDLASIPANAIITEARLNLTTHTVNNAQNHPLYIERVGSSGWTETGINWNNQPDVISVDQLAFSHAHTSTTGVHQFDVTDHVQHMVNNPTLNNGWRIRLQSEQASSDYGVMYHSSEATTVANRPTLSVEYVLPIEIAPSISHCTTGNNDGTLTASLSGGSTYGLSNVYFYKVVRDLTQIGKASLSNYKTTGNVQFDALTSTITAENLEPGVYLLRVLDGQYYSTNNTMLAFDKYILVGREGEVTSGILLPNNSYQENVAIQKDKPTNTTPLDRANTNYSSPNSILRVAAAPNVYEFASLIKYNLFFDDGLEFSKADLKIDAYTKFYRGSSSSNETNFTLLTSPWEVETVTWNTRPSNDPSVQVTVPATTTIGWEETHKSDLVSLLPFVEYWQANPNSNYGFEIALSDYDVSQYARRSYKVASTNFNFVEFEFSVKGPVSASYDVEAEKGSITVNAPSGHPLPYKYLISYKPLPSLNNIWLGFKDSIIPVDSLKFHQGNVHAETFTFENLDPEKYYVGVYDNNGVKIMDGNAVLAPEINLTNNSNVELSNGVLSCGTNGSTASAGINGLIMKEQNGGFSFEVSELGGNMVLGFNDFSQTNPLTSADFEYAIEFFADNSYDVLKGGSILFEGTVSQGDVFRVYKQNNAIVFNQNDYELVQSTILSTEKVELTGAVLFKTTLGSVSHVIKHGHFKPLTYPIEAIAINMECGEQSGKVRLTRKASGFIGGTGSYTIKDANTDALITSGTLSGIVYDEVDLPVGEYKVIYSYTIGGATYNYVEFFSIGHPIYWNILNDDFEAVGDLVNAVEAGGSLDEGVAMSQNGLAYTDGGWAYVNVDLKKYYAAYGDPIPFAPARAKIKVVNQEVDVRSQVNVFQLGDGILNKYIWVTGDPATAFTTALPGPIKVKRIDANPDPAIEDWDYEVSFNENPVPFSTLDEPAGSPEQIFHVMANGANVKIYECYASFCGAETVRSYADLTKKLDGGYYLAQNGIVKFIYNEEYNDQDGQLTYSIYDASNSVVVSETDLANAVVYGDNRYDLDFSSYTGTHTLDNGVYVLEVTNEKAEKWYLRFKIINN